MNYSFAYPKETTTARFLCVSKINLCLHPVLELQELGLAVPCLAKTPLILCSGFNAQTPQTHLACDFHITGTPLCPPHPGFPLAQVHGATNHKLSCPCCCLSLRWIILPFLWAPALTISLLNPFPSVLLTLPPHPSPSSACGHPHLCCYFIWCSSRFWENHFILLPCSAPSRNLSLPLASFHPRRKEDFI